MGDPMNKPAPMSVRSMQLRSGNATGQSRFGYTTEDVTLNAAGMEERADEWEAAARNPPTSITPRALLGGVSHRAAPAPPPAQQQRAFQTMPAQQPQITAASAKWARDHSIQVQGGITPADLEASAAFGSAAAAATMLQEAPQGISRPHSARPSSAGAARPAQGSGNAAAAAIRPTQASCGLPDRSTTAKPLQRPQSARPTSKRTPPRLRGIEPNSEQLGKMSRGERRAYMLRLIFESETSSANAALQKVKEAQARKVKAKRFATPVLEAAEAAAGAEGEGGGEATMPPRMAMVHTPQPPSEPPANKPAVHAFPRRPLPTGAGAVYIASGAEGHMPQQGARPASATRRVRMPEDAAAEGAKSACTVTAATLSERKPSPNRVQFDEEIRVAAGRGPRFVSQPSVPDQAVHSYQIPDFVAREE